MSKRNLATMDTDMFTPIGRMLQQAMAHGITNDMVFGGLEEGQTELQGLHVEQAQQNCAYGTRRLRWNGSVYYYAKATNIVDNTNYGVKFWDLMSNGIATTLYQDQAAGDESITIVGVGIAANALRGGCVMIHYTETASQQFRRILSNTATEDVHNTVTIQLDEPLSEAVTSTRYTEVLPNPYANVQYRSGIITAGDRYSSVAGVPNVKTAIANRSLWLQTWGLRFVNPHGTIGTDGAIVADERRLVFDWEGSICLRTDPNGGDVSQQHAGFVVNRQTTASAGPPLIMLQISP